MESLLAPSPNVGETLSICAKVFWCTEISTGPSPLFSYNGKSHLKPWPLSLLEPYTKTWQIFQVKLVNIGHCILRSQLFADLVHAALIFWHKLQLSKIFTTSLAFYSLTNFIWTPLFQNIAAAICGVTYLPYASLSSCRLQMTLYFLLGTWSLDHAL